MKATLFLMVLFLSTAVIGAREDEPETEWLEVRDKELGDEMMQPAHHNPKPAGSEFLG